MAGSAAPAWLMTRGEMVARIGSHEWGGTALGAIETWPHGLNTALQILLDAGHAMLLAWGPERIVLYNDAYAPMLGQRHPGALGQRLDEASPEVWKDIAPLVARIYAGETVRLEEMKLLMTRKGYPEDTWWDFCYSPIRGEDGAVAGLFAVAVDATAKVYAAKAERAMHAGLQRLRQSEARHRLLIESVSQAVSFLLRFSDALRSEPDVDAIAMRAIGMLRDHLQVDRCYITQYRPEEDLCVIPYQVGNASVPPMPECLRLSDYPETYTKVSATTFVTNDNWRPPGLSEAEREQIQTLGLRAMVASKAQSKERTPLRSMIAVSASPRNWRPDEIALVEEVAERTWALMESARTQSTLRESEQRLEAAIRVGRVGLWDWDVKSGNVHWSDEHFRLEGYEVGAVQPSYELWAERLHPDDREPTEAALSAAMAGDGEFEREFRVVHPDGTVRWLNGRGRFFYGEDGDPVQMIGAIIDTTDRREAEERRDVLIRELQHRTFNLLGVVRSVAEETVRSSEDIGTFRAKFADRIEALARVQRHLSRRKPNERITFDELIEGELEAIGAFPPDPQHLTLDGPRGVELRSASVQTFAMALHELVTNALKHGALGQDDASLSIVWRLEKHGSETRLALDWEEHGVAMETAEPGPPGTGQGRSLIEHALPFQLGAETSFEIASDGIRCRIVMPVSGCRNA